MERVVESLPKKESFFHTDQQSSRVRLKIKSEENRIFWKILAS